MHQLAAADEASPLHDSVAAHRQREWRWKKDEMAAVSSSAMGTLTFSRGRSIFSTPTSTASFSSSSSFSRAAGAAASRPPRRGEGTGKK